ncbi:39969_t:CDS:2, partial [Gigaspora margarita]
IRVKRLKKENIKEQLETHGILKDMSMNRKELVKELELVLAKETLEKTLASENLECNSISPLSNHVQNLPENEKSDEDSNVRYVCAYVVYSLYCQIKVSEDSNYVLTSSKNQYLQYKNSSSQVINVQNKTLRKKKNIEKMQGAESKPILNSSFQFFLWPLASGWALKSSQKYGKKGCGKRISKKVWNLLEGYFLEGNVNKSERHTAKSMLTQLRQCVENGIVEKNEVPKLETIQNWISHYASQHRQDTAEIIARARKKA